MMNTTTFSGSGADLICSSESEQHLPEGLAEWFDDTRARDIAAWEVELHDEHEQRQLQQETDDYSDL
jgi:hypothetical protein